MSDSSDDKPVDPADVVRRFWAARLAADQETTRELLDPDLTWRVVGRGHPVARTFHGHDGFLVELGSLLGSAFVPGSRTLEITDLIASGEKVVTELHETMAGRNGHDVVLDIVTVMRVVDGRITDCREYMDLAEVHAAFPVP